MIKPSDDCIFGIVVIGGAIVMALLAALVFVSFAGASSDVVLTPGHIAAASCAEHAMMPVINWSSKGALQIVELHQVGNCRLIGNWNANRPGLYCTGIGEMDGSDWVPDECVTVTAEQYRKVTKFRNIWKYRYQP